VKQNGCSTFWNISDTDATLYNNHFNLCCEDGKREKEKASITIILLWQLPSRRQRFQNCFLHTAQRGFGSAPLKDRTVERYALFKN
jgi:hypothetical protein